MGNKLCSLMYQWREEKWGEALWQASQRASLNPAGMPTPDTHLPWVPDAGSFLPFRCTHARLWFSTEPLEERGSVLDTCFPGLDHGSLTLSWQCGGFSHFLIPWPRPKQPILSSSGLYLSWRVFAGSSTPILCPEPSPRFGKLSLTPNKYLSSGVDSVTSS